MKFIEKIKEQARTEKKKIVLPETMDVKAFLKCYIEIFLKCYIYYIIYL